MLCQLLSGYINVDVVLNLSDPWFSHVQNGGNNNFLSGSL